MLHLNIIFLKGALLTYKKAMKRGESWVRSASVESPSLLLLVPIKILDATDTPHNSYSENLSPRLFIL